MWPNHFKIDTRVNTHYCTYNSIIKFAAVNILDTNGLLQGSCLRTGSGDVQGLSPAPTCCSLSIFLSLWFHPELCGLDLVILKHADTRFSKCTMNVSMRQRDLSSLISCEAYSVAAALQENKEKARFLYWFFRCKSILHRKKAKPLPLVSHRLGLNG